MPARPALRPSLVPVRPQLLHYDEDKTAAKVSGIKQELAASSASVLVPNFLPIAAVSTDRMENGGGRGSRCGPVPRTPENTACLCTCFACLVIAQLCLHPAGLGPASSCAESAAFCTSHFGSTQVHRAG